MLCAHNVGLQSNIVLSMTLKITSIVVTFMSEFVFRMVCQDFSTVAEIDDLRKPRSASTPLVPQTFLRPNLEGFFIDIYILRLCVFC